MKSPLAAALRNKFKTPQEALKALGLDESLLAEDQSTKEQPTMTTAVLSRKALLVQGASIGYLAGKLAADAKPDLTPVFAEITHLNFKASKPAIIAGVTAATKGKLASDAKLDDFAAFLGAFDEMDPAEEKPKAKDEADETEEEKEAREKKEKEAKDKKARDAKAAKDKAAKDETEEEKEKREAKEKKEAEDKAAKDKAARDAADPPINQGAMDEAVQAASKATEARIMAKMRGARDAEAFVRPWVGTLAIAYDSAEEIERAAAIMLKIPDADKVHASALRSLIKMTPKPGERQTTLVGDSKAVRTDDAEAEFKKMFPNAAPVRHFA